MEQLYNLLQEKLQQNQEKKQEKENQIDNLPEYFLSSSAKNQLQIFQQSQQQFKELHYHSNKINGEVEQIQQVSKKVLQSFEILKNRKQNTATVISCITAIQQFKKVIPKLEALEKVNDLKGILVILKEYELYKDNLPKKHLRNLYQSFEIVNDKIKQRLMIEWDQAIKSNNFNQMNICEELRQLLGENQTKIEEMSQIYVKLFTQSCEQIQKQINQLPFYSQQTQFYNYESPFFQLYLLVLENLAKDIEQYKTNVLKQYGIDGFIRLTYDLSEKGALPIISSIFTKFKDFYQIQNYLDKNQYCKGDLDRIESFCDEISNISFQSESFTKFLINFIQNDKYKASNQQINQMQQLSINVLVLEMMGLFKELQQIQLKQQIRNILEKSQTYKAIIQQDKNFAKPYLNEEFPISNKAILYDFLDEIFYLIKLVAQRSLETLNKTIACAILNDIGHQVLFEDFYYIINKLFQEIINKNKYGLSQELNIDNLYLIILLNNTEKIFQYLQQLENDLLKSFEDLYSDSFDQNKMIISSIENIRIENENNFKKFQQRICKIIAKQFYESQMKIIDGIKNISFQMNDQQAKDYEDNYPYYKDLSKFMKLSERNFEDIIQAFCIKLEQALESIIMQKKFNQIGAIILDKEIRGVISFFQNISKYSVKNSFSRLTMISEIIILENQQEMEDYYLIGAGEFNLEQIKEILKLRSDFN